MSSNAARTAAARQRQREQQQRAANVQRAQQAAQRDERQLAQQGLTVQSAQQVLDSTSNISSGIPSAAALGIEQPSRGSRLWRSRWNPLNRLPAVNLSLHPNDYIPARYKRLIGYSLLAVLVVIALAIIIYAISRTRTHLPDYVPLTGGAAAAAASVAAREPSQDRALRSLRESVDTELHELQQKLRSLTLGERALSRRIDAANDQLTRGFGNGGETPVADFAPVDRQLDQLTERETRLAQEASDLKRTIETRLQATIDDYVSRSELLASPQPDATATATLDER